MFNPNEHLMQIKNKGGATEYLPVQWRLVWFRELCPDGTIDTEEITVDLDREVEEEAYVWNKEKQRSEKVVKRARGYARFKATITDGKGGRATGTKSENAASFPDFIEKAETGAIGRALAALGYGTQFAPELNEMPRIVDSPVEQQQPAPARVDPEHPQPGQDIGKAPITEQQINSIRKLCETLGKPALVDLEKMSYLSGKTTIHALTAEYRMAQQAKKAPTAKSEPAHRASSNQFLSSAEVGQLRSQWAEALKIADEKVLERWELFKKYLEKSNQTLADADLTSAFKERVLDYLQTQKKAS